MVLTYAEEALQEAPMVVPTKLDPQLVNKLMEKPLGPPRQPAEDKTTPEIRITPVEKANPKEPADTNAESQSLEQAFARPKDLWVATACGWSFAQHSAEFYFLCGKQVDKLKCQKCESYLKGATSVK